MEQMAMTDELTTSETTAAGDPEWRYVPVRRTSMDSGEGGGEGGGDVAMEELVLQTEGDIAGNFRDTAEGETAGTDTDTLVFTADETATSYDYDDDGDLDLYVVNSPGGENALFDQSSPKLQEKSLAGDADPAGDLVADTGFDMPDSLDLV